MSHLSKNPFLDDQGNILFGKEIQYLNWNNQTLIDNNPFVDSDGSVHEGKHLEFLEYLDMTEKQFEKDLKKLPSHLRDQVLQNKRDLNQRMQAEATGSF